MDGASTDLSLAVAIVEYGELQELRRRSDAGSSARLNYFVALAAAGAAVSASLIASSNANSASKIATAGAIGGVLIVVGIVSFGRMVEYRISRAEYTLALAALRTYLVRRAPDVSPYVLLPTSQEPRSPRRGPLHSPSWVGLAMTVGVINSLVLASAASVIAWLAGLPTLICVGVGAVTTVVAIACHRSYERVSFKVAMKSIRQRASTRLEMPNELGGKNGE